MSDDALRDATARIAVDAPFRAAVEAGDVAVFDGLDLTAPEIALLQSLSSERSAGGVAALEPRLSKSSLFTGGTLSALHVHDTGTATGAPEGDES
jgi:hypothetical protein